MCCVLCAVLSWQDDQYDHTGAHVFLPGGNLRLLQGLAKDIPILYNSPAQLIQYCSKGVRQAPAAAADQVHMACCANS